jgi:uncharacterized membrane protein (DUF485 family)
MLHGPAAKLGVDYASKQKTRLGIILFFVYAIVYGAFVVMGVSFSNLMSIKVVSGLNLAVVYGMGLIILAAVMGYVYNHFCTYLEDKMEKEAKK